ncbi:hypothetical protein F5Y16DRAFT_372938 [Xylariaceae sp. FL0255]|nr:hypothetical protein F5Y16DRAFT_372938 [Xylariaceae sp. FL0255]
MSTTVQVVTSPAMAAQPTTAPVREHTCLFTRDLLRKQKRWQDGRFKHHTFNGRVMVYDERGNFIGDTHWREDYQLDDGEELELDRGGVIVQVGECVGSRDQDLSELVDKRAQERAQRQAAAVARRPQVSQAPSLHTRTPGPQPQKHLHSVIGTPSGHHGRALIPTESPYEERQKDQARAQGDEARPAKRLKTSDSHLSKSGYAQNLFGATLTLSGRPLSQAPVRHQPKKIQSVQVDALSDGSPAVRRDPPPPEPSKKTSGKNDQRTVKSGYAQNLFGATLALSGQPLSQAPVRPQPPKAGLARRDVPSTLSFDEESSDESNENPTQTLQKVPNQNNDLRRPIKPAPRPVITIEDDPPSYSPSTPTNEIRLCSPQPRQFLEAASKRPEQDREERPALKPRSRNIATHNNDKGVEPPPEKRRTEDKPTRRISHEESIKNKEKQTRRSELQSSIHSSKQTKHRRPVVTDLTEESADSPIQPLSPDEPRTELRIKPRKKRGLLMLSELDQGLKDSVPATREKRSRAENEPTSLLSRSLEGSENIKRNSSKSTKPQDASSPLRNRTKITLQRNLPVDDNDNNMVDIDDILGEDEGPDPSLAQADVEKRLPPPQRINDVDIASEDDDSNLPEVRKRQRLKWQTRSEEAIILRDQDGQASKPRSNRMNDDFTLTDDMPPPRLAKLARTSIRSREVIGLTFDDHDEFPITTARACSSNDLATAMPPQPSRFPDNENQQPPTRPTVRRSSSPPLIPSAKEISDTEDANQKAAPAANSRPTAALHSRAGLPGSKVPLNRSDSSNSGKPSETLQVDDGSRQHDKDKDRDAVRREPPAITSAPKSIPAAAPAKQNLAAGPIPRLVNPATRGKKAAKPSDAAGQVPVCPLPSGLETISAASVPNRTKLNKDVAKPNSAAQGKSDTRTSESGADPGADATLPGFCKARGDPWSKEAADLFVFKRPVS